MNVTKQSIDALVEAALDWKVAEILETEFATNGFDPIRQFYGLRLSGLHRYSEDWKQMGEIITEQHINLVVDFERQEDIWGATGLNAIDADPDNPEYVTTYGPTPLVAAARCFVMMHQGDEVDVPNDLLKTAVDVGDMDDQALNWAVAKALGMFKGEPPATFTDESGLPFDPVSNWAQGGPIMRREQIAVFPSGSGWSASKSSGAGEGDIADDFTGYLVGGDTPLHAIARCFVANTLGLTVEVPSELL